MKRDKPENEANHKKNQTKKQGRPNRKPFFRFIKWIIKLFKKHPHIIYANTSLKASGESATDSPSKLKSNNFDDLMKSGSGIYISNHSASSGPMIYELYFPKNMRMWGTYEMCGNFKMRWNYLNTIYFRQKRKLKKGLSTLLATILTPLMAMFYKGMQIIPTYPDQRTMKTINLSVEELKQGTSILIYPEDSSDGYKTKLEKYFGGFVTLANSYVRQTGKDINITNMYYHKQSNTIAVGNTYSYLGLTEKHRTREDITNFFLNNTNELYEKLIVPRIKKKQKKKNKKS